MLLIKVFYIHVYFISTRQLFFFNFGTPAIPYCVVQTTTKLRRCAFPRGASQISAGAHISARHRGRAGEGGAARSRAATPRTHSPTFPEESDSQSGCNTFSRARVTKQAEQKPCGASGTHSRVVSRTCLAFRLCRTSPVHV